MKKDQMSNQSCLRLPSSRANVFSVVKLEREVVNLGGEVVNLGGEVVNLDRCLVIIIIASSIWNLVIMWKNAQSNKVVSQKMKVLSYQKHMNSLKSIKPGTKIEQPWKPSFSLSKRLNKYHKFVSHEITKQNEHLLSRMLKIQTEPMRNTINVIPKTIPSNKETFQLLKARERQLETNEIKKQNIKIVDKIQNAYSSYNPRLLKEEWKDHQRYREILVKKESVPDYNLLLKEYEKLEKSRLTRPRTAFTTSNQHPEDSF